MVRIVKYDSVSQVLVFIFAIGVIASYLLVDAAIYNFDRYPRGDWLLHELNPAQLTACVAAMSALPLRIFLIRRLFRIGIKVEVKVERVPVTGESRPALVYSYVAGDSRFTRRHFVAPGLWQTYAERQGGRVIVIVNPKRPRSAMLEHAFELDIANPLPNARVVDH